MRTVTEYNEHKNERRMERVQRGKKEANLNQRHGKINDTQENRHLTG